jgi:Dolichyl-phosphate-mannose-protein mannosyltransferase
MPSSALPILLLCLATLPVLGVAAKIADRHFPRQPLQATLGFFCLVLLQITAVELLLGMVNLLQPVAVVIGAGILAVLVLFLGRRLPILSPAVEWSGERQLSDRGKLVLAGVELALLLPLRPVLVDWIRQIRAVHPLSWDVVSYHLPNAIDYLQTGSLWTIQGPFGYYPGGNELLNLWGFLPLHSDALLGLTTAGLALGSLLAAVVILGVILGQVLPTRSPFLAGLAALLLLFGCLLLPQFQDILFDFGRNDGTLMFWQLAALWTLLRAFQVPLQVLQADRRFSSWLLATGICLGMAIGTKPIGLYFLIGALIWVGVMARSDSRRQRIRLTLTTIALPAALVGGFWYVRNLIKFGRLAPADQLDAAVGASIFKNLFNPELYQLNLPLGLFLGSVVVTLLVGIRSKSGPLRLVAAWNAIALIGLVLTPSGAGFLVADRVQFLIQIRYAVVLVPLTLILVIAAGAMVGSKRQASGSGLETAGTAALPRYIGGGALVGLGLAMVLQVGSYGMPIGLPGFEGIFFPAGPEPSGVYEWVQKNLPPSRIYSVGLRPYGLYGFPFQNQVIAALGSAGWRYSDGLQAIRQHQSEYLALSLDPFSRQAPADLAKILQQPQAFEPVYQDSLALVFRITDQGRVLAAQSPPATVIH